MTILASHLQAFADQIRPQSGFVGDLRFSRRQLEAAMVLELYGAFSDLADQVELAWAGAGGLVVEASTAEANRIERVLGIARLREWSSARLAPVFQRAWQRALLNTVETFKTRTDFERDISALERQVLQMGGLRSGLVDIVGDTRKALFKALDTSRARDLDVGDAAKLIRDFVPDGRFVKAGRVYRSEMIAKTEMRSAQNFAVAELTRPGLLVASDGTGDETCASRDGQVFLPDEAIQEDSSTHPNCVLTFAPAAT